MSRAGTTPDHSRQRRPRGQKTRLGQWRQRFGRTVMIVAVLGGGGALLQHSGLPGRVLSHGQQSLYNFSAAHGFGIRNVLVEGRVNTDPDVLRGLINVTPGNPVFAFNPQEARDSIERISWVKQARVERRLPDTIFIKLTERVPLALWQNKGKLRLIDGEGVVLTDTDLQKFAALPLVVGEEAPAHAEALLKLLTAEPEIGPQVEAASWVGGRRWDLLLKGGVTVQLPPDDISVALRRLTEARRDKAMQDPAISMIDLRETGRMTVRTKPGEAHEYKASLVSAEQPI